jgi:uncharacterized protein
MTRNKMGTFDAVMKGIDLLKEHNLNFSVICVLTSRSLDMAEELYFFFEDLGASSVGFNIDEIEGTNRRSSMDSLDFADKIRDFWRALFKVHFARHSFRLREADGLVQMLRHGSPEITYNHQVDPLAILVVSVQGEVGTFSPELLGQNNVEFDNFSIGNIQTDSLADIIAGERYVRLKNEIEIGVNNCAQTCSYFEVCGGGPPSNKVFELGTFRGTETKYCRAAIMSVTDALVSEAKERMRSEGNVNALVALK